MQVPPPGGQIISQESELSRVSCPKSNVCCIVIRYRGNVTMTRMTMTGFPPPPRRLEKVRLYDNNGMFLNLSVVWGR